jgi:hypothetical protein
MKHTHNVLLVILLLSISVSMQAHDMPQENPLHMMLKEAKHAEVGLAKDDYQLCKQAIKGTDLSADELARVANICDQVLGKSQNMLADEVELCRDTIAKQLSEQHAKQTTRAPREPLTTIESETINKPQTLNNSDIDSNLKAQTDNGLARPNNEIVNFFGENVIQTSTTNSNTVQTELVNGNAGQVLIGGGSDPQWKYITSNDGTIVTDTGQNSLDLTVATLIDDLEFMGDNNDTAQPDQGTVIITGTTGVDTMTTGSIITIIPIISELVDLAGDLKNG